MDKSFSIPIKKYSIIQNNDDFLYVRLQIIKEGLNLNNSNFLLEGMQKCKNTFKQKPILCAYPKDYINGNYKLGDGHNSETCYDSEEDILYYSYLDASCERCVGFVPLENEIKIENIDGSNWIVLDAFIWKRYNYELVKELLKKRNKGLTNKISVEVSLTDFYELDNIEYIKEFIGDGITILATDDSVLEGIQGANLKVYSQSEKYSKFTKVMNFVLNGGDKKVFEKLSMNQLSKAIDIILENYKFDDGEWECYKYWRLDILETIVIVEDREDGKIYQIPYLIDENGNVSLNMDDIIEVSIDYVPKYNCSQINKILFISKDKIGTKEILKIDKSKESLSEDSWGDVNKSKLKKDCFMSNNWKTACKSAFLQLLDGWEDGKEGSLKYPVMQIKSGALVYNRYGLASAKAYAEKNNEKDVLSKIDSLYKKLGLDDNNKKEENMKNFIEIAKKNGYTFFGINNKNLIFSKNKNFDSDEDFNKEEMNKLSIFEIPYENLKCEKDEDFKVEDFIEKDIRMSDDNCDDKKEFEKLKSEYDVLKIKYEENEKLLNSYEENKTKFEEDKKSFEDLKNKFDEDKTNFEECKNSFDKEKTKFENMKNEFENSKKKEESEKLEKETESIMSEKDFGLDEKDVEELRQMRKENKFIDIKAFVAEVGYRKEMNRINKIKTNSLSFDLNLKDINSNNHESDIDKLINKLK